MRRSYGRYTCKQGCSFYITPPPLPPGAVFVIEERSGGLRRGTRRPTKCTTVFSPPAMRIRGAAWNRSKCNLSRPPESSEILNRPPPPDLRSGVTPHLKGAMPNNLLHSSLALHIYFRVTYRGTFASFIYEKIYIYILRQRF